MNRYKKEAKRKKEEARRGLSKEEIARLDEKEALQEKISEEARKLHIELFPEEYDHMYDSIADAQDRALGKNPMNKAYIEKVNRKREFMGVGPLDSTGMPMSDLSWNQCLEFVKKKMGKI